MSKSQNHYFLSTKLKIMGPSIIPLKQPLKVYATNFTIDYGKEYFFFNSNQFCPEIRFRKYHQTFVRGLNLKRLDTLF